MTNFIPIFPLSIVVYPGEHLNLHIFEPRYRQLVNECFESGKSFGLPVVIDNRLQEYGTMMKVVEISKKYRNGEMDIRTVGERVFRILEVIKEVPDKLYSGAIVNYPRNYQSGNKKLLIRIMEAVRQLHDILKVSKEYDKKDELLTSYDIAHHIGFTIQEEYELMQLMSELQRLEYIKRHLLKMIPMSVAMENIKEKIKQNGHFKNLKGFDFDI